MAQAAIVAKCDLCESEKKVDYFCTNCKEILCMNCKTVHIKSKKTKNDRIIPLTQAREDGIVQKSVTVFCDEHSSVEVTLFCLKCEQLVCMQCLTGKHNTHQVTIPDEIRNSKEESAMPPTIVATYQPGNRSRPNICKVQGKINIEQTMISTKRLADGHQTTLQVQDRENIQQEADTHKLKLQEQKTSGDNNQQQRHEIRKPSINVKKVRVKSSVNVQGKNIIYVIVPLQNKTAWVQADYDPHLTLIDSTGTIITTSVSLGKEIHDAKLYRNGLLVTCWDHSKVHELSADGKSTSTFSDLSPYQPWGLCVTHNMDIIVCLYSSNDSKVVRLNTTGHIIQTIQHDATGAALFGGPWTVTSLTSGEVIVIDRGLNIVGVDREGKHLCTWKGEIQGGKLDVSSLQRITHDGNNNLFVTDRYYGVFVLGKNGSRAMRLLDSKQGIHVPCGIAVDNTGQLWVGCCWGNIHIIEY